MMKTRIYLIVSSLLMAAAPVFAQTAGMLSFQGLIKDESADGLFDGTATLEFRIFDAESGGNLVDMDGDGVVEDVIGEDAKQVLGLMIIDGIASTKFGPVSPKAFDGNPRWLEVRITANDITETLDRIEMATAPATAEQLNRPASGTAGATTDTSSLDVVGTNPVLGSGTISSAGPTVTGNGSAFTTEIHVGDIIILGTQERIVVAINSDTELTSETAFDPPATNSFYAFQQPVVRFTPVTGNAAMTVNAQGTVFIPQWAGIIVPFGGPNPPKGWLPCDGSAVSRTIYSDLFNAIGTAWGAGDGSTTFHLPDLRGRFPRGVDEGTGRDPGASSRFASNSGGNTGDNVGSAQGHATAQPNTPFVTGNDPGHTHTFFLGNDLNQPFNLPTQFGPPAGNQGTTNAAGAHTHPINGGDAETRPKNVYVTYIIKY